MGVTVTILNGVSVLPPENVLLYVDVAREVNRIPTAQIILQDGSAAKQKFKLSNDAFFEPGNAIEIKIRYEGEPESERTVFKGRVMKHSVSADTAGSYLTVDLKHEAYKLTTCRKSTAYHDRSDAEVIDKLIEKAGLSVNPRPSLSYKHKEIVQYQCTDWDFILSRVDVNQHYVVVHDDEIEIKPIEEPVRKFAEKTIEYGLDQVYNFELEADASHQYQEIESMAWDLKAQALTRPVSAGTFGTRQGNLGGRTLASKIGADRYVLVDAVPVEPQELEGWANSKMKKSRMAMIRGRIKIDGTAAINPGDFIEIKGIGDRFNGKTLVTGVRHQVSVDGWQTDLQFGLSEAWFARNENIQALPAAGLLPAVHGLQIGVVAPFEEDPAGAFRVPVKVPALVNDQAGLDSPEAQIWARLAAPDAGATPDDGPGRGFFFRPEPGDEVVLGFFNDDPRQAVILGAMYSPEKNKIPEDMSVDGDNFFKGIVTRAGSVIAFLDNLPAISISTAKGGRIEIDDDAETVKFADPHGNTIVMKSSGIEIKSAKDVTIQADGNVTITGKQVDVN